MRVINFPIFPYTGGEGGKRGMIGEKKPPEGGGPVNRRSVKKSIKNEHSKSLHLRTSSFAGRVREREKNVLEKIAR